MNKILVVDDNVDICQLLEKFLVQSGFEVHTTYSGLKAEELIKNESFDLIICDYRLNDSDGMRILTLTKEIHPRAEVIILTGYGDVKVAVQAIKAGAYDYITKPVFPEEILAIIHKALKNDGEVKTSPKITHVEDDKLSNEDEYIEGISSESKELYRLIDLVAPTDYSVIILGESGTGKEAVAHTIHKRSNRKNMPFIAMDCGALTNELAGSELFGHEKGSFTGALNSKEGHFELANGGTLFLDEIGNLSYEIQISLLRVVQERKVKRIGGTKEINLDLRIIIASNENLHEAVQKGSFREDLFHRFNEFTLNIPPLRERKEDIGLFAGHFLKRISKILNKTVSGFSRDAMELFFNYTWPGNLRELNNVIKRSALLTEGELITHDILPPEIMQNGQTSPNQTHHPQQAASGEIQIEGVNLKEISSEAEMNLIIKVLRQVNFNRTKAAEILNIDRKTLYNKLKGYDL